jgi:uncharacterized repeat protein (TIGR03803 family)
MPWKFFASLICASSAVMSQTQSFSTLVNFDATNGAYANSSLVQGTDGNLYGTTMQGGPNLCTAANGTQSCGTVFKITPNGTLTTVYNFGSQPAAIDGFSPNPSLIVATNGDLYGTTERGGAHESGSIFKITPGGTFTSFYGFCSVPICDDGTLPLAGVVEGTDGNFYGTTEGGGPLDGGSSIKSRLRAC